MKRFIYIITAIVTIFTQSGCSKKFLDVESADKLYVNEYYTT